MKIIYIHQYFKTPQDWGGTRSYYLARAMVKAGHEVHLITSHNQATPTIVNIEGIRVYYLPLKYRQEFTANQKARAYCKFLWQSYMEASRIADADLVYATSTPLTVGFTAVLLKKLKAVPYIFEVRDLWPEVPVAMGIINNTVLRKLLYGASRYIYRQAMGVISLSPGITETVATYRGQVPIYELSNFADTDLFRPIPADEMLRKSYLKEKELGIVHFGTIGRVNHLEFFLNAAEASKKADLPLRFFIIGQGSEEARLKNEASERGLTNLIFLPPVPKESMPAWLSIMAFSYIAVDNIPMLAANSANKLYDSLAAGKICITNIEGWMQQMVEKEKCGFNTDPCDPSDFVGKIKPFLDREEMRKVYSTNARAVAERDYSEEVISRKLISALNDIAALAPLSFHAKNGERSAMAYPQPGKMESRNL